MRSQVCGSSRPLMMGPDSHIDLVDICQSCRFCAPSVGCIIYHVVHVLGPQSGKVIRLHCDLRTALVEVAISHVVFIVCIKLPHDMLIELDYARLVRSCFKPLHHFVSHLQDRFRNIQ